MKRKTATVLLRVGLCCMLVTVAASPLLIQWSLEGRSGSSAADYLAGSARIADIAGRPDLGAEWSEHAHLIRQGVVAIPVEATNLSELTDLAGVLNEELGVSLITVRYSASGDPRVYVDQSKETAARRAIQKWISTP
ncbi:hypothetical protein [Haloferula rosea]|uniref:Uncharacterized protein n=1 Tax=Haloferula rosea TaxID=490093 RepID=A0A934RIE0_9BACT|nr:hypothetical protein [Haloferula rosea]MBK1829071.1 hypothetical protein [Haloferula rosea]